MMSVKRFFLTSYVVFQMMSFASCDEKGVSDGGSPQSTPSNYNSYNYGNGATYPQQQYPNNYMPMQTQNCGQFSQLDCVSHSCEIQNSICVMPSSGFTGNCSIYNEQRTCSKYFPNCSWNMTACIPGNGNNGLNGIYNPVLPGQAKFSGGAAVLTGFLCIAMPSQCPGGALTSALMAGTVAGGVGMYPMTPNGMNGGGMMGYNPLCNMPNGMNGTNGMNYMAGCNGVMPVNDISGCTTMPSSPQCLQYCQMNPAYTYCAGNANNGASACMNNPNSPACMQYCQMNPSSTYCNNAQRCQPGYTWNPMTQRCN